MGTLLGKALLNRRGQRKTNFQGYRLKPWSSGARRKRQFTASVVVTGYKGTVTTKCEEKGVY